MKRDTFKEICDHRAMTFDVVIAGVGHPRKGVRCTVDNVLVRLSTVTLRTVGKRNAYIAQGSNAGVGTKNTRHGFTVKHVGRHNLNGLS